jgi:ribosomal protein L40E
MSKLPHENQEGIRNTLRALGVVLIAVGGIFSLIGLIDFFSAFGSFRAPTLFWCLFIGMPMMAGGASLAKFGYLGAVGRYVAGEVAPVAKDTVNYMADGSKDAIRSISEAVGEGLSKSRSGQEPSTLVRCHKCNSNNNAEAKFCSQCGASLQKSRECSDCGELNDPDARFCDNCGRALQ